MKIEGACHPVISVCPFNMIWFVIKWFVKIKIYNIPYIQVSKHVKQHGPSCLLYLGNFVVISMHGHQGCTTHEGARTRQTRTGWDGAICDDIHTNGILDSLAFRNTTVSTEKVVVPLGFCVVYHIVVYACCVITTKKTDWEISCA